MNNDKQLDTLAKEVIRFLKKWGLWEGTSIFTNGSRFTYTSDHQKHYKGICNVDFSKNVDSEEYLTGLIGGDDSEEDNKKRCLANSEHIFDMTYEGPLYKFLRLDKYEVKKGDIEEKAWDYIFEHTDILDKLLYEKYECLNANDLYRVFMEDIFDNPEYSAWDPLLFDTWKEYQEFVNGEAYPDGKEKKLANYLRYETYGDYLNVLDRAEKLRAKDIEPLWNAMVNTVKREFVADCGSDGAIKINIPEMVGHVYSEFRNIFYRYGLQYEFDDEWSLSCYKESVKDYVMFILKYNKEPDHNMHILHNFIEAWGMTKEGEIIEFVDDLAVRDYVWNFERDTGEDWLKESISWRCTSKYEWIQTDVRVKADYVEMYKSLCRRGRSKYKIMELMSEVIKERKRGDFKILNMDQIII